MTSDLELLRRFEPVIRLTSGELFLPSDVSSYVGDAALLKQTDRGPVVLSDHGTLTLERLAELSREHTGSRLSLRGVPGPLDRQAYRQWRKNPDRPRFRYSSRFAAVGIVARVIDSVMRLTLLARGRVPGGYTAAAQLQEQAHSTGAATYYGHVQRDAGYISLQYWFFYRMNDWRSTFGGVNDHEADWEQVTILLSDPSDGVDHQPLWVAFSAHDEVGDDLRRRWDDPDISFVDGTHPVVYAGAGSHSGAYLPGEYLISVGLPLPAWLEHTRKKVLALLPWTDPDAKGVAIPYIDYRRGDGIGIGPGQDVPWQPVTIDDDVPWVRDYTGLWGLDTHDPLGGERAPAGPRYDRDGRVRESWRMPVAWTSLDKQAVSDAEALLSMELLAANIERQLDANDKDLAEQRELLRGAQAASRAFGGVTNHPGPGLKDADARVTALRARQAELADQLDGIHRGLHAGLPEEPVHAHLRHRAVPLAHEQGGRQRLMRVWSAATASLLLATLGGVLLWQGGPVLGPVLLIATLMIVVEAVLRRRLLRLLGAVAVALVAVIAATSAVSIVLGNLRLGVGLLLLMAAAYMAWQTLREGWLNR